MLGEQVFRDRFHKVPGIFRDWLPQGTDPSQMQFMDFGCDYGVTTLGIAVNLQPKSIIGVDINDYSQFVLREIAPHMAMDALPENIDFHTIEASQPMAERFHVDCIFSWSVFEHVSQPILDDVILDLYNVLRKGGLFFMQIAPLYYSAFGSHLDWLLTESPPWSHLTTQGNLLKHQVMNAEKLPAFSGHSDEEFRQVKEGCWSCYDTLNKVTADEIIERFEKAGFETVRSLKIKGAFEASEDLQRIYTKEVLETEQVVCLFKK